MMDKRTESALKQAQAALRGLSYTDDKITSALGAIWRALIDDDQRKPITLPQLDAVRASIKVQELPSGIIERLPDYVLLEIVRAVESFHRIP